MSNLLPNIGTKVLVGAKGVVLRQDTSNMEVYVEYASGMCEWVGFKDIVPTPVPRQPWDVLREAAPILKDGGWDAGMVLRRADILEAAAAPKPLTLREAARAYFDAYRDDITVAEFNEAKDTLRAALALEESKK